MRKKYLFLNLIAFCVFMVSNSVLAQSVSIYNTTHVALNGAEINATANGSATKMGDAIVLAGTARVLDEITVDLFNLVSNANFNLTMSLYTDCPNGATGCGSGVGTLIPNSTLTIPITPGVAVGSIFAATFSYSLLNIDLSSETDNSIVVMLNASRSDVFWILNETVVVGSTPTGETATSVVVRCGSTVAANNGCTRAFTGAINNFAMNVKASPSLSVKNQEFADSFSIYPNPVKDIVKISSPKISELRSIKIYDFTGRNIKTIPISNANSNLEIGMSDLSTGNYLLKFESDSGVAIKKISKQ